MFELVQKTTVLLTSCADGVHINGHMRGVGVTCYSHNGQDVYCHKPEPGMFHQETGVQDAKRALVAGILAYVTASESRGSGLLAGQCWTTGGWCPPADANDVLVRSCPFMNPVWPLWE